MNYKNIYLLRYKMFFILTNMNPLHPRMPCTKFGRNWLSGSCKKDFKNFVNLFAFSHNYITLEKNVVLHLNKLEFDSPKG